jgi:ATP-binding cassette subfamily B (MDR/TAP) protein 7
MYHAASFQRGHRGISITYNRWRPPPWQSQRWCFHGHVATNAVKNGNGKDDSLSNERKITKMYMIKSMKGYIWPSDNAAVKGRVVGALGLLVTAKCLNTYVPILFKDIIDVLGNADTYENVEHISNAVPSIIQPLLNSNILAAASPAEAVGIWATSLVIGYGIARAGAFGFSELRNAVFAKVAQHSIRKIALRVFGHLHNLDLSFHLNRQTGALSKVFIFVHIRLPQMEK